MKSPFLMGVMRTLGIVRLDGHRQIAITIEYINEFVLDHLKEKPARKLKNRLKFPELQFLEESS